MCLIPQSHSVIIITIIIKICVELSEYVGVFRM